VKLNAWQQITFAVLAAFAVLLFCGSVILAVAFTDNSGASAPRTLLPSPTPTATAGVRTVAIRTLAPSPTSSARAAPTVTPVRTSSLPTATPRPTPVPIPTIAGYAALAQFSGEFYGDSSSISLPAGTIHTVLLYADDGEWISINPSDQYQHDMALRNIESAYQPSLSIIQAQLNMALATHDTAKIEEVRRRLDEMNLKKAGDIAAENDRFDALRAALQAKRPASNIRLYVGRPGTSPDMILTFLGSGTHSVDLALKADEDYFFHVESTGGWTLNIYHKR
jgi:hypothetical protein